MNSLVLALLVAASANAGADAAAAEPAAAIVAGTAIPQGEVDATARASLDDAQRNFDSALRRLELQLAQARSRIVESAVEHLENERALALEEDATHASR